MMRRVSVACALALLAGCGGDDSKAPVAMPPDAATPAPGPATPTAGDAPYQIVSPGRDSVWREGERYVIRWRSGRPGAVNVGAAVGGKDKGHLAMALPAGTDSLVWTVPPGFVTGFGPERSDAVRIRVEDAVKTRIGAESEPFTIVGAQVGAQH